MGKLLLMIVLLSGVIGLDTSRTLSYQIFSVSFALIIVAIAYSIFTRGNFICKRLLPPLATVGQPFQYHIAITNTSNKNQGDLHLTDKLQDHFPSTEDLNHYFDSQSKKENWFDRSVGYPRWSRLSKIMAGATNPTQTLTDICAGQKLDLAFSVTPLRRGYLHFTETSLGSPDPVGIFRKIYHNKDSDKLLVLPKRYPVPKLHLSGKRHHNQGGIALASAIGETSEFHGLRDYRPGDPLRHIHWRSWARTGSPVVKKYEDEFFVRHALILDTYIQNARQQVFEEAVSVAASIAINIDDQESLLDLMFVEQCAYHFTAGRHLGDIQSLLEILACVQAEKNQSIEILNDLVTRHASQLSSAICIFLDWDSSRQQLVNTLEDHNIEVLVLVVSDKSQPSPSSKTEAHALELYPKRFLWLETNNIEQGLLKLAQITRAQPPRDVK